MTPSLARPLDRAEAFFWLLDRCSSMNFAVLAEGSGPLDGERVAAALARAAARHPALGCAIEAGPGGALVFVPRPGAPVVLSREAIAGDWHAALAARLADPFALGEAPLLRAHAWTLPEGRWALAVVFHHAIGDGRSGVRLVKEILADAIGLRDPGPPVAAAPSLVALFPEALAGEAGAARAREWKERLRREPLRAQAPPGFSRDGRGEGVRPGILPFRLEGDALEALALRARAEGASVHGALGAAELLALRERFGDGPDPALMLTSPVDLRGNLAAPVDDATPGFYVTLLSSLATVAGPGAFWPLARFLTADLRRQVAEGCGHLFYHLVAPAEAIPAVPAAIAAFRESMKRMPTACVLSNVGRVEALPEANGVRVQAMSFALCPMAHQPLFVAATTWDGRLTVNVVHDADRLPPEAAAAVAAAMAQALRRAAG